MFGLPSLFGTGFDPITTMPFSNTMSMMPTGSALGSTIDPMSNMSFNNAVNMAVPSPSMPSAPTMPIADAAAAAGTFVNDGRIGPSIANAGSLYSAPSYMTPGTFEKTMMGLGAAGNLLGGIGSLYGAYEAQKYMDDQMAMQKDAYSRNVEADEKRQSLNF